MIKFIVSSLTVMSAVIVFGGTGITAVAASATVPPPPHPPSPPHHHDHGNRYHRHLLPSDGTTTECVLYLKDTLYEDGTGEESWYVMYFTFTLPTSISIYSFHIFICYSSNYHSSFIIYYRSCEFSKEDMKMMMTTGGNVNNEDDNEASFYAVDTMMEIDGVTFDEIDNLGAISGETILKIVTTTNNDDIGDSIGDAAVFTEENERPFIEQQFFDDANTKTNYDEDRLPTSTTSNRQRSNNNNSRMTLFVPPGSVSVAELSIDDVRHANHLQHRRKNQNGQQQQQQQVRRGRQRRNLVDSNPGTPLKTLVVRITDNVGSRINATKEELVNDVFEDEVSLKTGYSACSFNQLEIQPAVNVGDGTGIVDVGIDITSEGSNRLDVASLATIKAEELYTSDDDDTLADTYDLVLFCLPYGTYSGSSSTTGQKNWIAYAYINRYSSFYNDKWCRRSSAQMHEVGHNLNLAHSGINGDRYG